jgi:nucleoside-diphosphate-sugar epimerase
LEGVEMDSSNRKALIIGSEGNIGKPLVKYLKSLEYETLECDIRQGWREGYLMADINFPMDLLPAFIDFKPDVVFILSAMVSRVTCEQAAGLAIATNLMGVQNLLELCKRIHATTIFFSTSEIYGPDIEIMSEDISNPNPNNRYGLSKYLGEKLVEYEVKANNLHAVTLRPFMMYDEDEDLGDHRSAMIRFANNLALGKKIEVHRGSKRGWLHVSDAVRAIEKAAHLDRYEVINIGHPDVRPIEVLAETIRSYLNASKELIEIIEIPGKMTLNKNPLLKKQKDILGIEPKVTFEEGVKLVCEKINMRLQGDK